MAALSKTLPIQIRNVFQKLPKVTLQPISSHLANYIGKSLKDLIHWKGDFVSILTAKVVLYWKRRGLLDEKELHGPGWAKLTKAFSLCKRIDTDGSYIQ
jgi:hypothetical protein